MAAICAHRTAKVEVNRTFPDRGGAIPAFEIMSFLAIQDSNFGAMAQLFAFAALRALDGAGFDIVPKKDKPDADRP